MLSAINCLDVAYTRQSGPSIDQLMKFLEKLDALHRKMSHYSYSKVNASLHGLDACPLNKADLNSLDFVVNRFFMKLFRTGDINIVRECQIMCQFQLPSELLEKRTKKFIQDYDKFAAPLIYSDAHCG